MRRILVCGGRDYSDVGHVERVLDELASRPFILIHGGALGADKIAADFCKSRGYAVAQVDANWLAHGRAAGPIRNRWMLALNPDLVVAFPGGRGTADMAEAAEMAGIETQRVTPHESEGK